MAEIISNSETADLGLQRPHLKGSLNRISLASLLSWFDMSRMSERLRLTGATDLECTLYMHLGSVVDADGNVGSDPKETLRTVLAWQEGRFEFQDGPVTREDCVGMPMSALLLDFARGGRRIRGQPKLCSLGTGSEF